MEHDASPTKKSSAPPTRSRRRDATGECTTAASEPVRRAGRPSRNKVDGGDGAKADPDRPPAPTSRPDQPTASAAQAGSRRERSPRPLRRSRRWIELREPASSGPGRAGRTSGDDPPSGDGGLPAAQTEHATPVSPPRRRRDDELPSPAALLSPYSELAALATRVAISAMVESVNCVRELTARAARSGRTGNLGERAVEGD